MNPFRFMQEVRAELAKVTFPTRNETAVTTAMVFVLVIFAMLFFFLADSLLSWVVSYILGL